MLRLIQRPYRGLEFSYLMTGGLHHRLIFNIPWGLASDVTK